jgi:hypothetical protein
MALRKQAAPRCMPMHRDAPACTAMHAKLSKKNVDGFPNRQPFAGKLRRGRRIDANNREWIVTDRYYRPHR